MIAWTVATPDMMEMAEEAKRRIMLFGRVDKAVILPCEDRFECHQTKLEAWLDHKGPAWFFDADLWMVQKCPLGMPWGDMLIGNPDNSPRSKYDGSHVDPRQAINSSLVGMDMGSQWMRDGVVKCAMRFQKQAYGDKPEQDEKFLNLALWLPERPTMLSRLSTRWNWCSNEPPKDAIAVHAASQLNKLEWLQQAVKHYES